MTTLAPELELIELTELEPSRLSCDIGNHNNFRVSSCPEEAQWRLAYTCCGRASLMCTKHKNMFVSLCSSYRHEVSVCPHCKTMGFLDDVLEVTEL